MTIIMFDIIDQDQLWYFLILLKVIQQYIQIQMRHLQENTKFLEKYIQKVHDQLRMRIKFCNEKVTEGSLINMLAEYIDHQLKVFKMQNNKQNILISNSNPQNQDLMLKEKEIQELKEKMNIEAQLTRIFFNQIKRQSLIDASQLRFSYRQPSFSDLMSPHRVNSSMNSSEYIPAVGMFSQVNSSPKTNKLIESVQVRNSKDGSGRSSRFINSNKSSQDLNKQSRTIENQREKSKAFSRLRKVEAMFCQGVKKRQSRKKSFGTEEWNFPTQKNNEAIIEENQNLKAIQNNLVTHLSIMQKYKNVISIEELVKRQEKLKKKQAEIRELQQRLEKKERNINKTHIDALRRQKSIKML